MARRSNSVEMQVVFSKEKATKNTIRFSENVPGELDTPKIGTIYVPKATLKAVGWTDGKDLVLSVSAR